MPAMKVLDNENATMWYYPESKILHHQMHKFFFGQTFRDVMDKGVEIFQKYGADKWLSDDRAVTAWTKEDTDWGNKDWFPRVQKCGWKYWAIILPEKIAGQMTMKRAAEDISSRGVQTQFFSSVEEAMKWLESCH